MSEQRTPEERDIVDRLRSRAWEDRHHRKFREEAAAEIQRLRTMADALLNHCDKESGEWQRV